MKTELPDFDVLVNLARHNPDRLESLRVQLTQAVINSSDSDAKRRRLEGLQFQVDMERARAGTPLAACIKISEMMCRSLADLHRSMVTPHAGEALAPRMADVIPMYRMKRADI